MKSALDNLFESQTREWPLLAQGIEGLKRAATRKVQVAWFDVFIRHIPHRIASTTAAVDRASIAKRPCFLCAANLPPEEKGLQFDDDYTIYCNPFPILDRHITIVHREHRPQRIAGQLHAMLRLAKGLPGHFIVYNGPECGASAPDHMHFQACARNLFPIEQDAKRRDGIYIPDYFRNVLVFQNTRLTERAIDVLGALTNAASEPMINIAAFYEQGAFTLFLFPRGKHRPSAFHSGELTVSPASIDLCGIFVAPVEKDFEKITARDVGNIYKEVTLPDPIFRKLVEQLS